MTAASKVNPIVLLVCLAVYAGTMAAVAWGLIQARGQVVAELDTPEARQEWQSWAAETHRPAGEDQPVERRPVKAEEPPSLILMRDHFGAILGSTLVLGSFLFAFVVFLLHGVWGSRQGNPAAAPPRDPAG